MNRPIYWHQGLFLQPHHFQQEDRYFQSLLHPFHKYLQPHFWGVGGVEIQKTELENLTFRVLKAELLFPDNTHVTFPGNALIQPRSFEGAWKEGGEPFLIYLGVKKFNPGMENVTALSNLEDFSQAFTRYGTGTEPEEVPDIHQGTKMAAVNKLQYLLKIFWETEKEQLADYSLIPIARLKRSNEEIVLSEDFVPPSLTISSSGSLKKIIKEILDQITARGHQLEEYKGERGIHTAEFGARDMVYLLALRSLTRYAPLLSHFIESGQVHPWTVYGVIRQLIGELSSFSSQVNMKGARANGTASLPLYDHNNLGQCFSAAQALVSELLDEITAGPEYLIPLDYDGTYYSAELPPSLFEGRNRFYLGFETQENQQTVVQSLGAFAKLGSRETLPLLIARSLPGIKMLHLETIPQELPRRADSLYFQIDHNSDQWLNAQKGNNIALYWDAAPGDLKVQLMVVGSN